MRTGALILVLWLLPAVRSWAWMPVAAEQAFSTETTEAEACRMAEDKAKEQALRTVLGERLAADDLMVCTEHDRQADCILDRSTWVSVDGDVRGIRDKRVETRDGPVKGFRTCAVSMEVDIAAQPGTADPGFDLTVTLPRNVYRPGESLVMQIDPTARMYVTVFAWLPYEKGDKPVHRLFPNPSDGRNEFSARGTIPPPHADYEMQLSFPDGQPSSRKVVEEYLLVVATKKPLPFREEYGLEELKARILEMPRSESRLIKRAYSIVRDR